MIYLIDDDLSIRRAFELLLESAELKYVSFETANAYLSAKRPNLSDLLLIDLNMSDTLACELLKKLWDEEKQIPIIVITASDELKFMECCKKYGVKECLRKPVDGEALMDIIKYNLPQEVLKQ